MVDNHPYSVFHNGSGWRKSVGSQKEKEEAHKR